MKDKSMIHLGGSCAILIGILYAVVGVAHMVIPMEQRAATGDSHGFYLSFAENPVASLVEWNALGTAALLALAVVIAVYRRYARLHPGWMAWTSLLALLGFGTQTIIEFTSIARHQMVAAAYLEADAAGRAAIAALPIITLDPYGILRFGVTGLWLLSFSLLALRARELPRALALIGVAVGLLFWLLVAGFTLSSELLIIAGALLGGVIMAPIWFIWLGMRLRGEAASDTTKAMAGMLAEA